MKVQVVMSSYNGERHLPDQLDSIVGQRGVDLGLTVRDDGSTDGTLSLLQGFRDANPALQMDLIQGPHAGPAGSFMAALTAAADADYYAFSDQDDVWHRDKLARALYRLSGIDGPALYYSNVNYVDSGLRPLGGSDRESAQSLPQVLFENAARGCTMVFNRSARRLAVAATAPADAPPWMMHDWWLNLVVTALGTTVFDREAHIDYRQHRRNAVGGSVGLPAELAGKARFFLRHGPTAYRPSRQAAALLAGHADRLNQADRATLQRLCNSKAGFFARCAFALGPHVQRQRWIDRQIVRLLVLGNLY